MHPMIKSWFMWIGPKDLSLLLSNWLLQHHHLQPNESNCGSRGPTEYTQMNESEQILITSEFRTELASNEYYTVEVVIESIRVVRVKTKNISMQCSINEKYILSLVRIHLLMVFLTWLLRMNFKMKALHWVRLWVNHLHFLWFRSLELFRKSWNLDSLANSKDNTYSKLERVWRRMNLSIIILA